MVCPRPVGHRPAKERGVAIITIFIGSVDHEMTGVKFRTRSVGCDWQSQMSSAVMLWF